MLFALLALAAPLLAAADCSGTVNGTVFNLTSLTDTFDDVIGASGTNLPNLLMTVNPCAPVLPTTSSACSASACCVAETGASPGGNVTWASCGSETPTWSALPPTLAAGNVTGVLQTYGTTAQRASVRDVDTPCTTYTSQIAFICAQDTNSSVPVLATDFATMLRSECVLAFEWATQYACATGAVAAAPLPRVQPIAAK